ncbi:MAG TPA: cysteine desulfurase family protein, partial [Cytophagales bacterium]|nr:cysteine desulfurase family protein [Cytophagales bacterium]
SIHSHGREVKAAIEKARRTVASLLNTSPSEVFFTSGGTEADNTFLQSSIQTYNIKHAITSPIEHHAVLHCLEALEKEGKIKLSFVELDDKGNINLDNLKNLIEEHPKSLVSLMHANNEIGNLNPIDQIGELCASYGAIFHSDTVQTMGHYKHDLQKIKIASIVGSAHKFHGPKGVGFIYINNDNKISPFIHGGAQERNMRGGTENVYGIIGLAKALEIAYRDMEAHRRHIEALKSAMIEKLKNSMPSVSFNGESGNLQKSLYTVLNIALPASDSNDMLLFNLDISKISASGGSACSSGSNIGSHVLKAINFPEDQAAVRFSFSKFNTMEEVDYVVEKLTELYK